MKKQYDFTKDDNNIFLEKINDAIIQENLQKNTKIIIANDKNNNILIGNYCTYMNYKASFTKKDFCFNVFIRYFTLYKNNNINIEYNKIKSKMDFLKDDKNKRLLNVCFTTNTIESLYKLFLAIKNNNNI